MPFIDFMEIKQDLQSFYNSEAKKYASSRKKHRAGVWYILDEIRNCWKKTVSILEFGCGGWRLLDHLQEIKDIKINYTGVDISNELLKIAKKSVKNKDMQCIFVCDDIVDYIKTWKQESFDFIIGIASFQHIPSIKERLIIIKNAYRILTYGGKVIMINRALSIRFLKKYKTSILKSFLRQVITLGKHNFRDILVPRKSKEEIFYRYYHFFSLTEIKKLIETGGFIINFLDYVDHNGSKTNNRKNANNSLLIAQKSVIKESSWKESE